MHLFIFESNFVRPTKVNRIRLLPSDLSFKLSKLIRTPHDYLKANSVYCVISSVHPGGLVQGLRVTLMYINGLAKGTDSDNVRHSGPDTSLSHMSRVEKV